MSNYLYMKNYYALLLAIITKKNVSQALRAMGL